MKDYLWEVVKNTGMFIAGVSVIILYVVGLVISVCIAFTTYVRRNLSKR